MTIATKIVPLSFEMEKMKQKLKKGTARRRGIVTAVMSSLAERTAVTVIT